MRNKAEGKRRKDFLHTLMPLQSQVQSLFECSKSTDCCGHQRGEEDHAMSHFYETHTPTNAAHAQSNSPLAQIDLDDVNVRCLKLHQ